MSTLLYHETTTHGMIATPGHTRGVPLPSRSYHHEGHFLMVDGPESDVEDILKIAGYRLATPAEQNAYHAAKRKESQVVEQYSPALEGETDTSEVDTPNTSEASADSDEEKKQRTSRKKG